MPAPYPIRRPSRSKSPATSIYPSNIAAAPKLWSNWLVKSTAPCGLPEFARRFVRRIAELTGSSAGLLAVPHEGRWQVSAIYDREKASA